MDPKSAEQVFWEASQLSSDSARDEYLGRACGADRALRQKVERLLAVGSAADQFLESPPHLEGMAATLVAPEPEPGQPPIVMEQAGTQIGPYKLLQQIGEGGMGTVFMAEQAVPVKRRVALKIIKPGMDSRQVIARFEAERQALSLMDHPHIAKVLDAGTTPSGRPYFVMELVKGLPISQYCDEHHLSLRQRLELLLPVCQAIQHAHQKGIIHRDIKPSNILVAEYDQQAVPKVIDFGVAKAISQSLTEKTMFTAFGQIVGTIEYMSPEQSKVNQLDVDTRSDIYSLGVLLYELLTGTTPFDRVRLRSAAWDDMLRIIREEEPPRPSTRLSTVDALPNVAANRNIEPAKLSHLLRGELDWIVMKALEKDRSRRYDTVSALAADVQRYLDDEAVVACPPSAAYRFRKFARRNRAGLVTAGLVASALLLGLAGTTWQAIEASRASDRAKLDRDAARRDRDRAVSAETLAEERLIEVEEQRDAAHRQSELALSTLTSVIFDMQRSFTNLPGGGEIRRRLLETSLEKLEQVGTEYVEQASVDLNTLVALSAMGDVILQFGAAESPTAEADSGLVLSHEQRSAIVLAEQFYTRANEIAADLAADDPESVGGQRILSTGLEKLGDVNLLVGDIGEAREFYQQSLHINETLANADPTNVEVQRGLSVSYERLGDVSLQTGDTIEARRFHQQSLDIRVALAAEDPTNIQAQRDLSVAYVKMGDLHLLFGDTQSAREYFQKGLDIGEGLDAVAPGNHRAQWALSILYERLGNVSLRMGETAAARGLFQRGHDICAKIAADDPTNTDAQRALSVAYDNLGDACLATGETASARNFYQQSLDIRENLAAADPTNATKQRDLSLSCERLGDVSQQSGDNVVAREFYERSLAITERLAAADPTHAQAQRDLSCTYERLGDLFPQVEEAETAREFYQQSLDIRERLAEGDPTNTEAQRDLSLMYDRLGDVSMQLDEVESAREFYQQSFHIRKHLAAADPTNAEVQRELSIAYDRLGNVSLSLGEVETARQFYQQYFDISQALAAGDPTNATKQRDLSIAYYKLAKAAAAMHEHGAAVEHCTAALAIVDQLIASGSIFEHTRLEREILANELHAFERDLELDRALLEDWETFIQLPRARSRLLQRIQALARAGRFAEIPESAAMLRTRDAENAVNLYNAACGYAICANAIHASEGAELSAERQTQRQEYIDLALECLRESIVAGWRDFEQMQQDPDLVVLRELPEFEELLQSLPPPDP